MVIFLTDKKIATPYNGGWKVKGYINTKLIEKRLHCVSYQTIADNIITVLNWTTLFSKGILTNSATFVFSHILYKSGIGHIELTPAPAFPYKALAGKLFTI